jgi:exonuclease SbcD
VPAAQRAVTAGRPAGLGPVGCLLSRLQPALDDTDGDIVTHNRWCFVHAADLHLDTPFEGIGAVDPALATRLRDASLDAFDALIELTLARDAAFLVLAGDIYDGAERGMRAQLRFERGVRRLADAGIRTFVAHGNHDPVVTGWQLAASWPDEVHVFGPDTVRSITVTRHGVMLAVVQGVSYAERAETRNLARGFARTDLDVPHIGVLHANVGSNGAHAPYAPCTADDLRAAGLDYWALGHVHQREVVLDGTGDDPWALYPGNLQGRSHKPSERAAKGASVVEVIDGRVGEPEHVVLDRARFVEVVVTITEETVVGEVERELADGARRAGQDAEDRVVVIRGLINGSGPVSADLARAGAVDELLAALRDRMTGRSDTVWTGLRDRTRMLVDTGGVEALLDGTAVDDDTLVADAVLAIADGRWTDEPLDVGELATAGRALARTLLHGGAA